MFREIYQFLEYLIKIDQFQVRIQQKLKSIGIMSSSILTRLTGKVLKFSINQQITQSMTQKIAKSLQSTKYTPTHALFVTINSQGGSLTQAKNIANMLRSHALHRNIPLYCFAEDQCLGSANVILTAGSRCYAASEFGLIGDFGYSWTSVNLQKWNEKYQIKKQFVEVGKNKPGKYDIYKQMSPQTKQFTQKHLDILEAEFKATVLANRQKTIAHLKNKNANIESDIQSHIFSKPLVFGQDMINYGLLDQIATPEQIINEKFSGYKMKNMNEVHPFDKWRNEMKAGDLGLIQKISQKLWVM